MSTTSSDKSKLSAGFQETRAIQKKKVISSSGSRTPTSGSNVDMNELMKALKVVRKAKERNIDLSTSMESLSISELKPRHRRRRQQSAQWNSWRWILYVVLWVIAIAHFIALMNRNTVCPWIVELKTTEF